MWGMTDAGVEALPTVRTGPVKPGPWRIADIVDGRKLRIQLTAAALDNGSDPIAQRKRALDLIHAALFRGRMIAQDRLEEGADGLDTANLLSAVMDEPLSALYDFTVVHIFRAHNPTEAERMAVVAVGGYGRGVLAPSSDVDLLFVRNYKQTAWAESVIEYMLYALWDMGLKVGHSFRNIDECVKLSKEDVTIRTSILDKRFLFGDRGVFDKLSERFHKDVVQGRGAEFVAAKLQEREDRHAREGGSRYRVEPNVKDGKGGLRDLQTLFWLAKYIHGGDKLQEVLENSAFIPSDRAIFMREARFLWTVRCHLHFLTGRGEERLSFDLQPEMAARMGYTARGNVNAVERFMKRYFLAAKEVGALTRILCAKLEVDEKKRPGGRIRFMPAAAAKPLKEEGFAVDGGRLSITEPEIFAKNTRKLMRLFWLANERQMDIHPEALTAARRSEKSAALFASARAGALPAAVRDQLTVGEIASPPGAASNLSARALTFRDGPAASATIVHDATNTLGHRILSVQLAAPGARSIRLRIPPKARPLKIAYGGRAYDTMATATGDYVIDITGASADGASVEITLGSTEKSDWLVQGVWPGLPEDAQPTASLRPDTTVRIQMGDVTIMTKKQAF